MEKAPKEAVEITAACGHKIRVSVSPSDPWRGEVLNKAGARDCRECRVARQAVREAVEARQGRREPGANGLPDGAVMALRYDRGGQRWEGQLSAEGTTVRSEKGSVRGLANELVEAWFRKREQAAPAKDVHPLDVNSAVSPGHAARSHRKTR